MLNFYDIAYALGVAAASPVWATRIKSRTKVLTAFRERFGDMPKRSGAKPAVWIHAVSLGEVNAARALVEQLLKTRGDLEVIVSTTTTTGHERATLLYKDSPRVSVVRYPLDFTAAITRALDALRPSVVVLMELETWPNFLRQCQRRSIPVVLANGRITRHSFSRYRLIKPIVATMFRRLAAICVQDAEYATRFESLGAPAEKITVTGTMKYDSAEIADRVAEADELQRDLRLSQDQPLWVCGSTGPGEEAIVLRVYRGLLEQFPDIRLAIIPRHPQRFDEVAELIRGESFDLLRRSNNALPLPVRGERVGERASTPRPFDSSSPSVPEEPLSLYPSPLSTGKREEKPASPALPETEDPLPSPLPEYKEREAAPLPINTDASNNAPASTSTDAPNNAASPISTDASTNAPALTGTFLPTDGNAPSAEAPVLGVDPSKNSLAPDATVEPTTPANLSFGTQHSSLGNPIILGDTMGELRKFYSLATVVFVGRSLVDLGSRQHGSDMIEPAALGKPCIVGPFTGNFDQAVRALKSVDAIVEAIDEATLDSALRALLSDPAAAAAMGKRAQDVVRQQQGATALHLRIINTFLAIASR